MKVMKFGGTSVGSVESILNVKKIVEAEKEPVIVVVSALGGLTDKLITLIGMSVNGEKIDSEFEQIVTRHTDIINNLVPASKQKDVTENVMSLLTDLRSVYYDISVKGQEVQTDRDLVVSFGERMSSVIIANVINGAHFAFSPDFIKTSTTFGKHSADISLSTELIKKYFVSLPKVTVCPGFITKDKDSDVFTNLGRGGSDYTAAILAAALHAEVLEIWTDVDGFMTADPRVISKAYVIDTLSYVEAMELCNYGAKVIYPPTIFPAYHESIPILIKNTFNPEASGTFISREKDKSGQTIKGISSINDTALVTMQGLGMVGVIGVSKRLFGALANVGISAFFISQASSENTISIGITNQEADLAVKVISDEFKHELTIGEINSVKAEKNLATIAVVGDNMKRIPGISGKLFGALGRSGVNVVAIAQRLLKLIYLLLLLLSFYVKR